MPTGKTGAKPVSIERNAAAITEEIRLAISGGVYAPGQRLIEADLCDRFGTSRFILRTALQDLAGQGLVEFRRNRGARVRAVSLAEAIEITEVRKLLEGLVAARAAERATEPDAADLEQIIADLRDAAESGELLRHSELNTKLHIRLREIAYHQTSSRLLDQMRDLTVRHQFTLSLGPRMPMAQMAQHEAIVAAVIQHDPLAAEQAMHEHLESVIAALRGLAVTPAATDATSNGERSAHPVDC